MPFIAIATPPHLDFINQHILVKHWRLILLCPSTLLTLLFCFCLHAWQFRGHLSQLNGVGKKREDFTTMDCFMTEQT